MAAAEYDDVPREDIEVRVLGPLRVRRADGTVVRADEWPTAQTADLVRLLALRVDEAVPVDHLVDTLWPTADEQHGRASLRTAASRVRKLLGEDCIHRRHDGLVLTGAWVDAHAFRSLAQQAHRHLAAGELADCVVTARRAHALYLGDFRPHHDTAEWATEQREALAALHRGVVADAAEAAAALGWWQDAVDLAERALEVEPCSERAFRALMRGQHGLGETAVALKTYERCRRRLAEEVGADPSGETRQLHADLLADAVPAPAPAPFAGREHEVEWLRDLQEVSAATREPVVALVLGESRSGKTRLVEHACAGRGGFTRLVCRAEQDVWAEVVDVVSGDLAGPRPDERAVVVPRVGPTTVLVDDVHRLGREAVTRLGDGLLTLRGPVTVVIAGRLDGQDERVVRLLASLDPRVSVLGVTPLGPEEVAAVCAGMLGGRPAGALVAEVMLLTAGRPGAVVRLVRDWLSTGRTLATTSGVVLRDADTTPVAEAEARRLLVEASDRLTPFQLDVLQVLAAVGRPMVLEDLLPVLTLQHPGTAGGAVRSAVDHVVDLGLVREGEDGVAIDAAITDLLLAWMRPSARRRVHRQVAESAPLPSAERAQHWQLAGEPNLARAASWEVARAAVREQQFERARVHLRRLAAAADAEATPPAERADLYEQWADAAARVGRLHESRAAYAAAAAVAAAHGLPSLDRLEGLTRAVEARGVGLPAAGLVGGSRPRVTANLPGDDPADDGMDALPDEVLVAGLGEYPGAPDAVDDGSQLLDLARRDADDAGDGERGARARAALIRDVCVPRRRFRTARRWAQQALGMTVDPTVCAEVLVQVWSAGALLGDAAAAEEGLGRAAALLPPGAPDRTVVGLAALQALVAHDLGRRDLLDRMAGLGRVLGAAPDQQWVLVRMATERGDLAAASKADQVPEPDRASVASRTLRRCASAALAMELGRAEEARELLLEALDFADRTGVTLAAPEAVARLIVLDARTDLPSARRRFEQFEEYVGADTWYPRENVLKLLARAAMRAADGRPDDAAAAASGAADVAERAGLVHLAAQAHRHRAYHHAAAGRAAEARLAATAGSRWRSVAGTTTAVRAPAGGALSLADPDPRAALGLPGRTDGVPGVASA